MHTTNRRRTQVAAVAGIAIAAALIAAASLSPAKSVLRPASVASSATPAPMVGVATGDYENGLPVYRLPAVTVTANRSTELAKIAQEERLAWSTWPDHHAQPAPAYAFDQRIAW